MAMTLRADKGAILSWNEMDANFRACLGVHNLLHVQDQKPTGTYGGTFTSGAWRTRDLNTVVVNAITGSSLSSNQITLPAGTYFVFSSAVAMRVDCHISRLFNTTNAQQLLQSTSCWTNSASSAGPGMNSIMFGFFYTAGCSMELQHRCSTTLASYGLGYVSNIGQPCEIFADLKIWKLS